MALTILQEKLEVQFGKDIRSVLVDALEARRGQTHFVARAALDLGITNATVYQWCREFGINIEPYRRPLADPDPAGTH